MKPLITKEFAEKSVLKPLGRKFKLALVGSLNNLAGTSYNDIDILMLYNSQEQIEDFRKDLEILGWAKDVAVKKEADNNKGDRWNLKLNIERGNRKTDPQTGFVSPPDIVSVNIPLDVYYQQSLDVGNIEELQKE